LIFENFNLKIIKTNETENREFRNKSKKMEKKNKNFGRKIEK